MLRTLLARARELVHGRRIAEELDEELRLHLELEIEHNVARGMTAAEARRAAIAAFGGVQRFREETRDARGFAAGVIATLAVGLGAANGIGALVYGVMLRPLPYPDPDRLVRVEISTPGHGITATDNSSGTYVFFRERARSFAELGAYMENEGIGITDGDVPERVTG